MVKQGDRRYIKKVLSLFKKVEKKDGRKVLFIASRLFDKVITELEPENRFVNKKFFNIGLFNLIIPVYSNNILIDGGGE